LKQCEQNIENKEIISALKVASCEFSSGWETVLTFAKMNSQAQALTELGSALPCITNGTKLSIISLMSAFGLFTYPSTNRRSYTISYIEIFNINGQGS
jgi:hypothetical protein